MECTISIDKLWAFIEELNKRIDKSEASIAQGNIVSHNDVMNMMNDFIRKHS